MKISDFVPNILGGGTQDAVSLLISDHEKVQKLFKQFDEIKDVGDRHGTQERERIVAETCKELTAHTTIEEEIFYPATRAAIDDDDLMNEAQVEHDGAKRLIAELEKMNARDEMFTAKFTVLSEYIKHHVKEEERDMFPKARKSELDLEALGKKMLARKRELTGSKRPASRSRPNIRKRATAPVKTKAAPSRPGTSAKM